MVTVAVNVTVVPWQTGLSDTTIEMLIGRTVLTVIFIGFEVTMVPEEHWAVDVIWQVTISLLAGK